MKILIHPIIGKWVIKKETADKIMRRANTYGWEYAKGYSADWDGYKTEKAATSGAKRNKRDTKSTEK